MILLSDANVIIDLAYVGGIWVLPRLADTEILDLVLMECEHPSQPMLVDDVKAAGIRVIPVQADWINQAEPYRRNSPLSMQDCLNVFYAKNYQRTLLAGDLPLREVCHKEGIDLRGSIWIVQQAFEQGLVPAKELLQWMKTWPEKGRRLPKADLKRLADLLQTGAD